MPEIDQDLFRWLVLGGIGLGLLLLLLVLSSMARIAKLLRDRSPAAVDRPESERPSEVAETQPEEESRADQRPDEESKEAPAASTGTAEPAGDDDPKDEPFQREGRWWFRRDDELLIYDEQSGEWQPVDEGSPSTQPAEVEAVPVQTTSTLEATPTGDERAEEPSEVPGALFWKCPACGAVNGLTATSCRMCFAAKP